MNFEQPTVSGRDRVNINAILNAHNPIDKRHEAEYIYIISDNVRYYKNKELTQWLEGAKIKQLFLPPYSPNLNLIERLWEFLRKKVINTGFYRTKEIFRKVIIYSSGNIGMFK